MMRRDPHNPVITPADVIPSREGLEVIGAFNAGAAKIGEETLLLLRVAERPTNDDPDYVAFPHASEDGDGVQVLRIRRDSPDVDVSDPRAVVYRGQLHLTSISHLRLARSTDGVHFRVDPQPTLVPSGMYEEYGIEDPRITYLDGRYLIVYTSVSRRGVTVSLIRTPDFRTFERMGVIFPPENKDVAIFPARVGGRYAALHRPSARGLGSPDIWLAYSEDLRHWGDHRHLLGVRKGMWDGVRIGAGSVPFMTEKGWLAIYHGADETRYCLGGALMDAEAPHVVLARSQDPILVPEAPYETNGFFHNAVFTCGTVVEPDGTLRIFYGAADQSIALAVTSVDEVLDSLEPVPVRAR
ncbi:glycoside hydrolase family 130 protein [Limnochorda pilosa]|uniref:Glycosidase n=1 Tax=Limnochorda pilosa TaxID=1555112 RepID=A0A0K2SHP8_LIMPI|nr:glycoside hydrolase family 130 protein [Limnochorda pilosa]BAS26641.1 glycosidase [Limnochorda pilosa]